MWLVPDSKAPAGSPHEADEVSRDEVHDQLVSSGGIDWIRRELDDEQTTQLVGPRRVPNA